MEFKTAPSECRIKSKSDGRTIEGYASTFGGPPDSVGDVVLRGAFAKTIRENGPPRKGIKLLWRHSDPLGLPYKLAEDSSGLHFEAKVSKTRFGDDCLTLIRDGVVDKMSIGYSVVKQEFGDRVGDAVRYLKELRLFEISPVTFPANSKASILAVKSAMAFDRFYDRDFSGSQFDETGELEGLRDLLERTGRALQKTAWRMQTLPHGGKPTSVTSAKSAQPSDSELISSASPALVGLLEKLRAIDPSR